MPKQSPELKKFYTQRKTILELLLNIVDEVPELSVPAILVTLMRRKGGDDPYFWTDEQLIEKLRLFQQDIFSNPLDPVIIEKDF
jgi:hypothetical protein